MKIRNLLFLAFIMVAGCATYPKTTEEWIDHHSEQARKAILSNDPVGLVRELNSISQLPAGKEKIKEFLAKNAKGKGLYLNHLDQEMSSIPTPQRAGYIADLLVKAEFAGIVSEEQRKEYFIRLEDAVAKGNLSGSIPFEFGDKEIDMFPILHQPAHKEVIFDRSIKTMQSGGRRSIPALIEYIQKQGVQSSEAKRVEALLPVLNIRREELETVAKVFPVFSEKRREELTMRVFLQVKNADRLFADDLVKEFSSKIKGVEWVKAPGSNTISLTVERVRHDEKTMPERTETITYSQSDVNIFAAALLMPRNASYIYDVISGGVSLDYGYVVAATMQDKQIHDEIIRGGTSKEYRRCQNARIQNVFGGVQRADFVANNDMQYRCSGVGSASIQELRNEVMGKIVDGVLNVKPIRAIHDLN